MMAEIAATFGIAVNVLQAVAYSAKFIETAWKIWHSGQGGLDHLTSLQVVAQDMKDIARQLGKAVPRVPRAGNESSSGIFVLAEESSKIAQRVIDSVDNLGIPSQGRKKLQACAAAFRLGWNNNEITSLQIQLDRLRSQIMLDLIASTRFGSLLTFSTEFPY